MALKDEVDSSNDKATYDAADITVLEGLDPVRKRPGMYIGSTGPTGLHHLVWEVVDNSIDEAMAGYCDRIEVTLLADGGVKVVDNGRGIPIGLHPKYKDKSAAEVVLTVLHAGGKFGEGGGYKVSGGLHGVGVSVVNALSTRLLLEIDLDGDHHVLEFKDGGKPVGKLEVTGPAPKGRTGTTVSFWPDPTIFEEVEFRAQTVIERLQVMAFLNKGLEIHFVDERVDGKSAQTFKYKDGIVDYVRHLNASKEALFRKVCAFEQREQTMEVEVALQWNSGFYESIHSFANGISTIDGGMHEEGFKKSLTNVVNKYARAKGVLKEKDENMEGRTSGRGSPPSSRSVCRTRSSRARPRASWATSPSGRWWSGPPTRSWPSGSRRTPRGRTRSSRRGCWPPGPGWPPARPVTSPAASRRWTAPACRASSSTARPRTPARANSSSSRATPPVARPRTPGTPRPRPSCPSGARS